MNYSEFIELTFKKAGEKGISDIFEKEANYVETGYDRRIGEEVFKMYGIIPQHFKAVEEVDTSVEFFGKKFNMPIFPAALSRLTNITDHPILKIAQAAKTLGIMTFMGVSEEDLVKEVAGIGAPTVKIMKPYRDFEKMKHMVEVANACGLFAVGTDLDLAFGKKTRDEIFFQEKFSPKTADQIAQLVEMAKMPFLVKGVLSPYDAKIAKEIGCKGIIVTNHGNMVIDYIVHPLEVLPQIREAVGEDIKIIVNGGIRRGSDIFKCLALGADAVTVGKMTWMGLIANDKDGVVEIFNILNQELKRYMGVTGAQRIEDINASVLHKRNFILPSS